MSAADNGGPAFPAELEHPNPGAGPKTYMAPGMTLRDYFAAEAMKSLIQTRFDLWPSGLGEGTSVSGAAYIMADTMLEARK